MSICSFCSIDAKFPLGTELDPKSELYPNVIERGGEYELHCENDGCYSDYVLEDVVDLFGKPLDEVPGLSLDCWYELMEDDGWRFNVWVDDGKVTCQQTETRWVDCTVEDLNIGPILSMGTKERKRNEQIATAKLIWSTLDDVLVDDDGCLLEDVQVFHLAKYDKGTPREEIWHDIEERYGVSVAYLMGQAKNPDGTN